MSDWGFSWRLSDIPKYDFMAALDTMQEELIQKTISLQEAKFRTWEILTDRELTVPPDLVRDVEMMTTPDGWNAT